MAVAVNPDGRKKVLGLAVLSGEAEVFWDEILAPWPIVACARPA